MIKWDDITAVPVIETEHTPWRKDAPPSVALVASGGDANFVLSFIGREWNYLIEVKSVNDWMSEVILDPGIWMVDIAPSTTVEYRTDCGTDYDIDMNVGDIRKATAAEVMAHGNEEYPWDPSLWLIGDYREILS